MNSLIGKLIALVFMVVFLWVVVPYAKKLNCWFFGTDVIQQELAAIKEKLND